MFDSLSDKIQKSLKKITGKHRVRESDVTEVLSEIKLTLLEADVNFKVVKNLINSIQLKAVGTEILDGLDASQQIVKIVQDELEATLGSEETELQAIRKPFGVIMFLGLQGSGKTTHTAKIAAYLRKKEKKAPFLIAADVYRPAAIDQLQQLAKNINVPIFFDKESKDVVDIVKRGMAAAKQANANIVLIDTAGRLQIDETLMIELQAIDHLVQADDKVLVLDAMIGQDAINVARSFNEQMNVTGTIFTKLDGDTRAGALLSIRAMLDLPVLYIGLGEKIGDLEKFYPDRIASRILGMGDIQTLIENVEETISEKEAEDMQKRMLKAQFTFNDFKKSIKMIERLGGIGSIFSKLGGVKELRQMQDQMKNVKEEDAKKRFRVVESIIDSMTEKERNDYTLLKTSSSRRIRVAKGSGHDVSEVNMLLKQFEQMRSQMKKMSKNQGMFGL
jgi:signal recognition particle subunit SRP54